MSRHLCWGQHHPGNQGLIGLPSFLVCHIFFQPPGNSKQDFQLLSDSCLAFPRSLLSWGQDCFWQTDATPPSPNPGRALASMTANPLHHLGLIRAQWRMISLHIKALKQLDKLAPSQSPARELALNSEALPMGAAEVVMKAREPQAGAHRRSSVSQEKKCIPAVASPYCASASPSPWLSASWLSPGCCSKLMCGRLSVLWRQIIMSYPSPLLVLFFYPVYPPSGIWTVQLRNLPRKERETKFIFKPATWLPSDDFFVGKLMEERDRNYRLQWSKGIISRSPFCTLSVYDLKSGEPRRARGIRLFPGFSTYFRSLIVMLGPREADGVLEAARVLLAQKTSLFILTIT